MAHTEQDAPFEGRRGRCAVLSATGAGPPDDLNRVLGSRALDVMPVRDVFEAMTEISLHERRVIRGECDRVFLLVVVEPDQVPQAQALARAAAVHAPHAGVWQYRANASPQLSALVTTDVRPAIEIKTPMGRIAKRIHRIARALEHGPTLRLAGTDSVRPAPQEESNETNELTETESADSDSVALTAEELTMLLAEEPGLGNGSDQDDGPDEQREALER